MNDLPLIWTSKGSDAHTLFLAQVALRVAQIRKWIEDDEEDALIALLA